MAIREIVTYPAASLRKNTELVDVFDQSLRDLYLDMADTMYAAPGIGLAAIQVDVLKQIFVLDVSEEKNHLQVYVNPQIIEKSDDQQEYEEGCLSIPGHFANVVRPASILVRAQNLDGEEFEQEADGLLAVCIQHEYDHLHGRLFIDYLSRLKQQRLIKKIEKERRLQTESAMS